MMTMTMRLITTLSMTTAMRMMMAMIMMMMMMTIMMMIPAGLDTGAGLCNIHRPSQQLTGDESSPTLMMMIAIDA